MSHSHCVARAESSVCIAAGLPFSGLRINRRNRHQIVLQTFCEELLGLQKRCAEIIQLAGGIQNNLTVGSSGKQHPIVRRYIQGILILAHLVLHVHQIVKAIVIAPLTHLEHLRRSVLHIQILDPVSIVVETLAAHTCLESPLMSHPIQVAGLLKGSVRCQILCEIIENTVGNIGIHHREIRVHDICHRLTAGPVQNDLIGHIVPVIRRHIYQLKLHIVLGLNVVLHVLLLSPLPVLQIFIVRIQMDKVVVPQQSQCHTTQVVSRIKSVASVIPDAGLCANFSAVFPP